MNSFSLQIGLYCAIDNLTIRTYEEDLPAFFSGIWRLFCLRLLTLSGIVIEQGIR